MKPVICTLGLLLSLSLLFSQTKQNAVQRPGLNGVRLSKLILRHQTKAGTYVSIIEYQFDRLNRVSWITFTSVDTVKGKPTFKRIGSSQWLYKGNEQLPYKAARLDMTDPKGENYFFYDNDGKLIIDSAFDYNSNMHIVNKYEWFSDKILTTKIYYNNTFTEPRIDHATKVINNNNIVQGFATDHPTPGGYYCDNFAFDDKTNPIYNLNIRAALAFTTPMGLPTLGYNKNNITELTTGNYKLIGSSDTFSKIGRVTYSYKYNAANLPVECETTGETEYATRIKIYYSNYIK